MALFVKEDKTQRTEEAPVAAPRPAASDPSREPQAQLAKGSRVEGKLSFEGSVRIEGQIDGEIKAQGTVTIADGAHVTAQITASVVVIEGKVEGDVTARKRVELRAPAKLTGNLSTPSLVVHDGVVFEGNVTMSGTEGRSERGDKRVAIFPTEDRNAAARVTSEAGR